MHTIIRHAEQLLLRCGFVIEPGQGDSPFRVKTAPLTGSILRSSARARLVGPLVALAVVLAAGSAAAQPIPPLALDPDLHLTQYVHESWQVEDGLPQNSVYAFAQTPDGYFWLGTQDGLARFDGVSFTVFDKANTSALQSSEIRALLVDRDSTLWIGTRGGGLTHLEDGQFTTYMTAHGLTSNDVMALHQDVAGNIWIGTLDGGVTRFNGQGFRRYSVRDGLAGNNVVALAEDGDGRLWIGTDGGLTSLYRGLLLTYGRGEGLPATTIRALSVDDEGTLWVGTDRGLAYRQGDSFTTLTRSDGLCGNGVSALLEDAAGILWIGTMNAGLCRLYDGVFSSFTTEDGLSQDRVRALFQDHEGSLWIGTEPGGVNRLRMPKFMSLSTDEGLSNDAVFSVLEDRTGTLWVGTLGGGLNRLAPDGTLTHFTTRHGLPSNQVISLHEDRDGTLWVGLFNGGLCRWRDGRFDCLSTADGLSNNNVFSIHDDRIGHLWIGTGKGLNRLHDGQLTTFTTEDGLSSDLISSILESTSGVLWIGTRGGGLNRFRNGRFTSYTAEQGLSSETILTLYEDNEGILWIGTKEGGLCRLRVDSLACFTAEQGLYSDNILQIVEDDDGHLWLGSLKGVARISKATLEGFARGDSTLLHQTVFGPSDGLKSRELNGGTQPAAWKGHDGRLYFSTIRGVATVDPSRLARNTLPPPVVLQGLHVNGSPVAIREALSLPPGSRDFEFRYTALSFVAPDQVTFEYKMEGYDKDWVEAGTRRTAYYTNLPAGPHRFRVKARNGDGVWSEVEASLAFHVRPFFYETYWFYVLCAISVVALGAGAYRLRVRHLHARERELQQRVQVQTSKLETLNRNLEKEVRLQVQQKLRERKRYEQELIAAKEKAEESAQLKSTILQNMSHEIRTPISAILGYAQVLSEELREPHQEFVDYIQENGRRLLNTLNSILDLSKIETDGGEMNYTLFNLTQTVRSEASMLVPMAHRKGISLRVELPDMPLFVQLDETATTRILRNLIGNAIKFTNEGEVALRTGTTENTVFLEVRDTGIGISEAFLPDLFTEFTQESSGLARSHEGSGLGLAITQRLVHAMGGDIAVESQKGAGTVFTASFPHAVLREAPRPGGATPAAHHGVLSPRSETAKRSSTKAPPAESL